MADLCVGFAEMVISGDVDVIATAVQEALNAGTEAHTILDEALCGMSVVGQRFKVGDMFIPEVLRSAAAMNAALDVLQPLLSGPESSRLATVVIGTVEGDIHSIGKDLVATLLQGAGFRVVNLGVDVKSAAFVQAIQEH